MGYLAELNDSLVTGSVTLSGGGGTLNLGAFPQPMALKQLIIQSAGTTTAGATFTLKSNNVSLADVAIPNGYNGGADDAGMTIKDFSGVGPASFPAGAAGPLPATGAVTTTRQIIPAQHDIKLVVASGTGTDVLNFTFVLIPGGNFDTLA